jgi:metal-responsive CopG/Arc/MetJ family transcriptional regulator
MEKIKTSISLDKDIYEKIKEIGKQEDRSFSQQVNKILKDYLSQKFNKASS